MHGHDALSTALHTFLEGDVSDLGSLGHQVVRQFTADAGLADASARAQGHQFTSADTEQLVVQSLPWVLH